jgi:hypothetical protein
MVHYLPGVVNQWPRGYHASRTWVNTHRPRFAHIRTVREIICKSSYLIYAILTSLNMTALSQAETLMLVIEINYLISHAAIIYSRFKSV